MRWKNLRIRSKIGLGFSLIIGLMIISSVAIIFNLSQVEKEINNLSKAYIPSMHAANNMNELWREVSEYSRSFDFTADPHFNNRSMNSFSRVQDALRNLTLVLNNETKTQRGEELSALQELIALYDSAQKEYATKQLNYLSSKDSLINAHTVINQVASLSTLSESSQKVLSQSNALTANLFIKTFNRENIDKESIQIDFLKKEIITKSFTPELKIRMSDFILKAESYFLNYKSARLSELNRYNLAKKVMWEVRKLSEIGIDQILEMGIQTLGIMKSQRKLLFISILFSVILSSLFVFFLVSSITKPIYKGILFAEEVAKGNLTADFKFDRKDEVGRLAAALNKMVGNINNIVTNIRQNANKISESSDRLTKESIELSEGASEQAASAEEVSSSMEEMYANIQKNTENSKETEVKATNSAKGIIESNKSSEIASQYINEITTKISAIGDIAFKTNILALNAAVEAARAGEKGKGFSVVASEVKKLAESSQIVAKEINQISQKTLESSEDSMKKLANITPEIEKTAELMQEISAVSVEQVSGVEQINNAVQQFNKIVQRNAVNSDAIKSAAEELVLLSNSLNEAVLGFTIG